MDDVLNLDRYPIENVDSRPHIELVTRCRKDLLDNGMFNLEGLVRDAALRQCLEEVVPVRQTSAFTHKRRHNVYFKEHIDGVNPDHPALATFETVNHTVCADQIPGSLLCRIYDWPPLVRFLADVMEKETLYTMADPIARLNVMAYGRGEALNWHFDRSEFTTTLLLQAPEAGGEFQYRSDLRSDDDPNYDGVAKMLAGEDPDVHTLSVEPGTLTVFRGVNTIHRVSPVVGDRERLIAVLSYYEQPGVRFSDEDNLGFYGRVS